MSELRTELVLPAEQLVAVVAAAIYVAYKVNGLFIETDKAAEVAWDLYDSTFAEADERYKEKEEEDADPESGGPRHT